MIPQQEENNIFDSKTGILSFENNYVYFSILRRPQTRNNVGETMLRTFATQGNVSCGNKICFPEFASREAEMFPKFVQKYLASSANVSSFARRGNISGNNVFAKRFQPPML